MAQRLPVLYNKKPCYDIVFQQSFDGLWEELAELGAADKRLCIVDGFHRRRTVCGTDS